MIEPSLSSKDSKYQKNSDNSPTAHDSPTVFLTEEESMAVDQTLLSAKDKFSTRVAIYSLRVLQSIAAQSPTEELSESTDRLATGDRPNNRPNNEQPLGAIEPNTIIQWLAHHQPPTSQLAPGLEPDPAFDQFFAQLVLSALNPLSQISTQLNKPITSLIPSEIIAWFEQNNQV